MAVARLVRRVLPNIHIIRRAVGDRSVRGRRARPVIGERVRLAREACLLTQQELAQSVGAPLSAIADVEVGRVHNPSVELISGIASATSFPLGFFKQGALPHLPEGHYRRLKRGTARVSKQVRAQVRQILELVEKAEATVSLPPVKITPAHGILTSTGI